MPRTQISSSHREDAVASTRQRVAAFVGLLALGFLLGHVHPAHDAETGHVDTPVVSGDHDHHEHSSHVVVDTTPCVGCRSFDEHPIAATRSEGVVHTDLVVRALPDRAAGASRAPFAGLPATRAPPIA